MILEHCSRTLERCSRILEATLTQKLRNIRPNLGHSRNGIGRLAQTWLLEISVLFWDTLEMARLGCLKYAEYWSKLWTFWNGRGQVVPSRWNIGSDSGHFRNITGLVVPNIWNIDSNSGHSINVEARMSQIYKLLVQFLEILKKFVQCWSNFRGQPVDSLLIICASWPIRIEPPNFLVRFEVAGRYVHRKIKKACLDAFMLCRVWVSRQESKIARVGLWHLR